MTHYKTLNVKFSNSQLNKLKSRIKNNKEVTLWISSDVVDDSNDKNNFPHKLFLTNTKASKFRKAFANRSSANKKLSKTQLLKTVQPGGFSERLLGPLLKTVLSLIWNVLKPLPKSVLIPLALTASASATDQRFIRKCLDLVVRH